MIPVESPSLPKRIKRLGYEHHAEIKTQYQPTWIPKDTKAMFKSRNLQPFTYLPDSLKLMHSVVVAEKSKSVKADFLKKAEESRRAQQAANGKASLPNEKPLSPAPAPASAAAKKSDSDDDVKIVSIHQPPTTTPASALAGFSFRKKPAANAAAASSSSNGVSVDLTKEEVVLHPESPYKTPPAAAPLPAIGSPGLLNSNEGFGDSPAIPKVSRWQRLKPAAAVSAPAAASSSLSAGKNA